VTERQIREVVDRGARSLDEVKRCLPVATRCGCCEESARELIEARAAGPETVAA
jgi:bacterioferritin-associated ferredoxin